MNNNDDAFLAACLSSIIRAVAWVIAAIWIAYIMRPVLLAYIGA